MGISKGRQKNWRKSWKVVIEIWLSFA